MTYSHENYEVWKARGSFLSANDTYRQPLGQVEIYRNRNRKENEKIPCVVEIFCEDCYQKQLQYEKGVVNYVNRYEKKMLHTEVFDAWRGASSDEKSQTLPWHGSKIIELLAKEGHPYVEALIPVDGREYEDYSEVIQENPKMLLDSKSLSELDDNVKMPASYVLLARPGIPLSFNVISRYLKCPDFVNTIQVYRLRFDNVSDPRGVARKLGAELYQLIRRDASMPYTVLITEDVYSHDKSHTNNLLIALIRRYDGSNQRSSADYHTYHINNPYHQLVSLRTLYDEIAKGDLSSHYESYDDDLVENALREFLRGWGSGGCLHVVQHAMPLSSSTRTGRPPFPMTSHNIKEKSDLSVNNPLQGELLELAVNCRKLQTGVPLFGFIQDTQELVQYKSKENNAYVPLVFKKRIHAQNVLNDPECADILKTLYCSRW
jgi:hypothetical protein